MSSSYLPSVIKQFQYYKLLGDKTFAQIPGSKLTWSAGTDDNSIAVIVKHLWGNMLSRWTDFLSSDGEKEWRQRDKEFVGDITDRDELLQKWQEGWAVLFTSLESLADEDLERIIHIRNQGHTVVEAINRQLAHYSYHVGQIVHIGKVICGPEWKSLSIPKGASSTYNASKFSQAKERRHFTDEYLKDKSEDS